MTIETRAPVLTPMDSTKWALPGVSGHYDALTGLLCRSVLDSDSRAEALSSHELAVVMVELDQFSRFNREHGRAIGDFVLAMTANRLTSIRHGWDSRCYRYDGDCFVQLLWTDSPVDSEQLKSLALDIQQALKPGIHLADQLIELTCTVTAAITMGGAPLDHVLTEAQRYSSDMKCQGVEQLHILNFDRELKACG
ncbi:diguanylate cyclase domain-containing protein [Oceanospirillum sp.]|uniref:diguanylate cyclase domain-containing protein n=1 Tax=Oceanospirillum sp. TaxID=2021254 RepID=UPI003A907BAC